MADSFVGRMVKWSNGTEREMIPEVQVHLMKELIERSRAILQGCAEVEQKSSVLTEIMNRLGDSELTRLATEANQHLVEATGHWAKFCVKADMAAQAQHRLQSGPGMPDL